MEYCLVGEGQGVFGIKGEIKVFSHTDFPDERFKVGSILFLQNDDYYINVTVRSSRKHKSHYLISFNEFPDINAIEKYAYCNIVIEEKDKIQLPEGKYYPKQLIGLEVFQDANSLGRVIDVDSNTRQSILRVNDGQKEVLIPFVDAFILEVNLESRIITINPKEGLI